jgi:hypothetical protein
MTDSQRGNAATADFSLSSAPRQLLENPVLERINLVCLINHVEKPCVINLDKPCVDKNGIPR